MLNALFITSLLIATPSAADALPAPLAEAVRNNARAAGLAEESLHPYFETAQALADEGIAPRLYLNKLSEGLAKRVPPARLATFMDIWAGHLRTAHRMAADNRLLDARALSATLQLLSAGLPEAEIQRIFDATRTGTERNRRFAAAAFGARKLHEAGISWNESVSFQSALAARDLSPEALEDVGDAVAAAVRDGLLDGGELAELPEKHLGDNVSARRFIGRVHRGNSVSRQNGDNAARHNNRGAADKGREHTADKARGRSNDPGASADASRPDASKPDFSRPDQAEVPDKPGRSSNNGVGDQRRNESGKPSTPPGLRNR